MKNTIGIIGLCCMVMCSLKGHSQTDSLKKAPCTITFSGMVLDGETNEPLPGASVFFKELNKGASTNEKGEFFISSVCPGKHEIVCSSFGYKEVNQSILFNRDVYRNYILHTDTCQLESVVIVVEKKEIENTQPVLELKGKELNRTSGLSLGEIVKTLPGVNTIQTGPTIFKPVIQGMYGNRVLIMNNGVRLEGQQWGAEHAPEIDPFIADKISVIKGAAGVKYGSDAIGGVILINPKELRKDPGLGGEINLAGFSNNRQGVASGFLDYNVKKIKGLSLRLQGTLKQGGNFKTPDYYLKNTGLKEYNFSWAAEYNRERVGAELFYSQFNSLTGIFSASHIGNLTDLQKAINSDVPLETEGFTYDIRRPYQDVGHELGKIKAWYKFKRLGRLDLVLARQYNYRAEYDKHRPYNNSLGEKPQVEFRITTHTANIGFTHYTLGNFSGEVGVNLIRQANTTGGTARSFIPNFRSFATGVYWIERWRKERLEIEAGIRYDNKWMEIFRYENNILVSPDYQFSNFSGTVGGLYDISKNFKFSLNLGNAFRPPAVNELFSDGLHHGSARIETGNSNLKPEISYSSTASLKYNFKRVYGELTAYHNYIKDYIYLAPLIRYDASLGTYVPEYRLTIRGAFPAFEYKQINASFTGVDFTFNDSLSNHFIFSSRLSLLRAYNNTSGTYLILTPPANMENGLKYRFNFSKKITDPYLKLSQLLVLKKSKVEAYEDFKEPPPAYVLLQAEAGFTLYAGKQPLDVTFTVYNLLNSRYRDYLDRFRYFADGVGRNFALRIRVPLNFSKTKS